MPKRLDKPIDAETALSKADSFLLTVRFLAGQPMHIMAITMLAQVLCAAFCTELYMKILAQLERAEPPLHGHNLEMLAGDLSAKSYRRIAKAWKKSNPTDPKQLKVPLEYPQGIKFVVKFEEALARSAKAFIDWRYGEKHEVQWWQLSGVPDELREIIMEMRPEWRPSTGPRTELNPKPNLAEAKGDDMPLRPPGWAILNPKPAAFNVRIRRSTDPKDRGSS